MIFMAEELSTEQKAEAQAQAPEQQEKQAQKPRKARPRKPSQKKANKIVLASSKRKRSIARGSGRPGTGVIRINGMDANFLKPEELRSIVFTPVYLSEITKNLASGIDISINVKGGGLSSQAQASASVIAKVISDFSPSDVVKKEYMRYDRHLLIDDVRRVEPKKYLGPKARARFQTSYR